MKKNKPKLLIADDDITTLILLRASIVQWGFEIVETDNGEDVLSILHSPDAPQILIIDWLMPKLDGITLCTRICNEFHPRPYVIISTHNKGDINLVKAIEAGADQFIEKPINLEILRCRLLVASRVINGEYQTLDSR